MSTSFSRRSLVPLLVTFSVFISSGRAFTIPGVCHSSMQRIYKEQYLSSNVSPRDVDSMSMSAKKRRRRRKDEDVSSPSEEPQIESFETSSVREPGLGDINELPDFDLDDGELVEEEKQKVDSGEITANMMGSGMSSSRTIDELIQDRALESKFEFEEKGDPSIPDFVDLAKASTTVPSYTPDAALSAAGVGKKKQRQAERIARAVAAKEAKQEEESLLAKYFPQFLNEKGQFSAVKFLEQGAWIGIFLLIAWEAYINSPFFERAAPLAPVVFEIVM